MFPEFAFTSSFVWRVFANSFPFFSYTGALMNFNSLVFVFYNAEIIIAKKFISYKLEIVSTYIYQKFTIYHLIIFF